MPKRAKIKESHNRPKIKRIKTENNSFLDRDILSIVINQKDNILMLADTGCLSAVAVARHPVSKTAIYIV